MPEMPESVASDDYQSHIWASVTASGRFSDEDAPNLALLCYWHAVAKAAEDAMSRGKSVKVLKQATAEIRALNELLGLSRKAVPIQVQQARPQSDGARVLSLMFADRERKAKAAGA